MNSEIDILIEDRDYFAFVEAKEPIPGQKVKFQDSGGVRQLVRQFIQGKVLQGYVRKPFALATIGANDSKPIGIELNTVELDLMKLVNERTDFIEVPDLSWERTNDAKNSRLEWK